MKRAMLRTSAPAGIALLRLWLAADIALDAVRTLGVSHYLGESRVERFVARGQEIYLSAGTLAVIGWAEAMCAAMLAIGIATRVAIAPAALGACAAIEAWTRVGTLGTAGALDRTLHGAAVVAAAGVLLMHGGGTTSMDAWLTRRKRARRKR